MFITFPLLVIVFLPMTLSYVLLSKIFPRFFRPVQAKKADIDYAIDAKDRKDLAKREYDIVLYGATGYTGKLAAKYLTQTYGNQVRWAIAGRRKEALEEVRRDLLKIKPDLDLPILIGDSSSPKTLQPIINDTRVFLTTVGPYDLYGTPIVALCAHYGTSYCDITGETNWVRKMIESYDHIAKASGARIVHFCANDCIPWDISTVAIANSLKSGEQLKTIKFFNELNLAPSGGTMATAKHHLAGPLGMKSTLGFDPLIKSIDGSKSDSLTIGKNPKFLSWSSDYKAWVGPWVMADVNLNCVRRSNAIMGYHPKLEYSEFIVYPGFMAACVNLITMAATGTALFCPPIGWAFDKLGWIPQQGAGPNAATLAKGFLKVTGIGTGSNGTKIRSELYYPNDTGYVDTARMVVESAMVLLEGDKLPVGGGVWTPAVVFREKILERLQKGGTQWDIKLSAK